MALPDRHSKEKITLKSELIGLVNSFKYAFQGLKHVWLHERNFRIHTLVSIVVIICNIIFKINNAEWFAIIFCIAFVLVTELINTSIEVTIDLVTQGKYHPLAKIAKDVAAAAVVIATVVSVSIGLIIYLPYLSAWLF
ncbi:diacylglycerol kinase family protein [Fundicoccus sp. Sow4_H7]|uniref:diacylglycerol kinase family protein n=1 Tax=Fundicoccus sp. Sow4_H7 TaxID=3438784 RepID=UPI003F92AE48